MNKYLTRAQHALLARAARNTDGDDEDEEDSLISDSRGRNWMCGWDYCTRSGRALLELMLIKPSFESGGTIYYVVSESGRKALADPTFEPPGKQIREGRRLCDCPPAKRAPTPFDTCGYCSRLLK